VKLIEVIGGSTSSTKQFVWTDSKRREERDGSGSLTKKFYARGQDIAGTKYFYCRDLLGSVREVVDNSGNDVQISAFDSFGRRSAIFETVSSDFTYAGYYSHARSGLLITLYRQYDPKLGCWLSRDPLEEEEGSNLYGYAGNNPLSFNDPLGLTIVYGPSKGTPAPPTWCPKKRERIARISKILDQYLTEAMRITRALQIAVYKGKLTNAQMGVIIDNNVKYRIASDPYLSSQRIRTVAQGAGFGPDIFSVYSGNDNVWWDITKKEQWDLNVHQNKYDSTHGYGIGIIYQYIWL
jgi:RHS repeat-associated protein